MSKKQDIKFICEKCGKEQPKDETKSTKDWNVFENKPCVFCGGKTKIDF